MDGKPEATPCNRHAFCTMNVLAPALFASAATRNWASVARGRTWVPEEESTVFEGMFGRFVGGAIWGVGAGLALTVLRGGQGPRAIAKGLMKVGMAAVDRAQEFGAEARESIEDLYAEAKAEQAAESGPRPRGDAEHAERAPGGSA